MCSHWQENRTSDANDQPRCTEPATGAVQSLRSLVEEREAFDEVLSFRILIRAVCASADVLRLRIRASVPIARTVVKTQAPETGASGVN